MTGRTCQLCGKPLSRFSVGSGGDFCSREHRNQFRLRLGMDRLTEANKVASLMRRRENAKTFSTAQLISDGKPAPRAAAPMKLPPRPSSGYLLPAIAAALGPTAVSKGAMKTMAAGRSAVSTVSMARSLEAAEAFSSQQTRPLLRPRTQRFPVQLKPAQAIPPSFGGAAAPRRRSMGAPGWSLIRTHVGSNGIQVRKLATAAQNCQEPMQPRPLLNCADRGRALRVSGGIGFRVPSARLRRTSFDGPRTTPLLNTDRPRRALSASEPQGSPARRAEIRITIRGVFGPTPPAKNGVVHFHWPSILVPGGGLPRDYADTPRSCQVEWQHPAPFAPELRVPNDSDRFQPSTSAIPLAPGLEPQAMPTQHRLTLVAFEPQETPFECSPTALHGTLVSGMQFGAPPTSSRKTDTTAATIEEHFDAGLQNWLGGTDDWKVDVAGVRPGSLAVYSPSLEYADYLLEFLARFETGVTWVFRAANFSDYYQASLAVAAEGGYEFRRCTVLGGVAEAPVCCPVATTSSAPAARTAVTLRTRVTGDEFTVSLDGKVVDTWTDSRLANGGVGFVGAPDDRARLYWVKLTPAGQINKEHSKQ